MKKPNIAIIMLIIAAIIVGVGVAFCQTNSPKQGEVASATNSTDQPPQKITVNTVNDVNQTLEMFITPNNGIQLSSVSLTISPMRVKVDFQEIQESLSFEHSPR
jgi:flagellar basal body-associated protein FliL